MSPARVLPLLLAVAVATPIAAGCGSSDGSGSAAAPAGAPSTATATSPAAPRGASARSCEGTVAGTEAVRVTGVGCDVGRGIVAAWAAKPACSSPDGASRFSCTAYRDYRCQGAATERGIAVSCARPGSSVSFVAKRG